MDNDVTTLAPPGRTQMAMQYIVDHCAEPITSADIAAAAGLSQRGLQQAFARAELPPPITALRQARLEAVRTALQHADPTVTTVGEIATAWGFAHLGRFSGYYEAAFGEFPRATLHRSA
ncbi:helix-turn-helix domain-containing protein [Curtobacterium flaccumfaciens]|nr:helix-turn-helix domain-containing protein [Curtobacterium flaccumfaciens]